MCTCMCIRLCMSMYVNVHVHVRVHCMRMCMCMCMCMMHTRMFFLKSLEIQTHVVHRDLHVRKYAYVHRACILDAHDLSTCMSYAPASDCQYASKHKCAFACTYMYAVCMDVCMSVCVRIYLKLCGSCRSKATSASESKIPRGCWGRWAKAGKYGTCGQDLSWRDFVPAHGRGFGLCGIPGS